MGIKQYMTEGVIKANIYEDGGHDCYQQVPYQFHVVCCTIAAIVHFFYFYRWNSTLSNKQEQKTIIKSNIYQKIMAFSALIAFILTFYYKVKTMKGMFIFNPCHISILLMIILLIAPSTPFMRKLHTCWASWVFGAYMALFTPHLQGISTFQVYLYYYEHLLLVPFGPMMLKRRYGYLRPNLWNQLASFSTLTLYQVLILTPFSRLSKVNLNFTLCHSHADIVYDYLDYHYYSAAVIYLNLLSFICRYITYFILQFYERILSIIKSMKYRSSKSQKPEQSSNQ